MPIYRITVEKDGQQLVQVEREETAGEECGVSWSEEDAGEWFELQLLDLLGVQAEDVERKGVSHPPEGPAATH